MRFKFLWPTVLVCVCALLVFFGWHRFSAQRRQLPPEQPPVLLTQTAPAASMVTAATQDFGFRLFGQLTQGQSGNVVVSPTSISLALSMTYNGAAGSTATGMAKALGITKLSQAALNQGQAALIASLQHGDPQVTLAIANALWAQQQYQFRADYLQRVQQSYQAKVATTNLASPVGAKLINDWVTEQTRGKIAGIAPPQGFDPNARLVLTDALYFKGQWTQAFSKGLTETEDFTLANGGKTRVPMMARTGHYPYFETPDFQAIGLPYGASNRFEMLVFLPKAGKTLAGLGKSLDAQHWQQWMRQFKIANCELKLPRFTTAYTTHLETPLSQLGMADAFSDRANFSGMTGNTELYISQVLHQTRIEVNEEGTEAVAVTTVVTTAKDVAVMVQPIPVIIDHPFFFAIRDKATGALLFMGQIVNPQGL